MKCWKCNKEIQFSESDYSISLEKRTVSKRFCRDCFLQQKEEYKKIVDDYIKLKTRIMFERAIKLIEKQNIDIGLYKEPSEVIYDIATEDSSTFDSSYEMVAGMELLRNRIQSTVQAKILTYRVDFKLPEYKVILEIDGERHKANKNKIKDSKRDIAIRKELGPDWEVVRIPTKYLEENISRLKTAIVEISNYQRKMRKQNYGMLSDSYSDREKLLYKKIVGESKDNYEIVTEEDKMLEEIK